MSTIYYVFGGTIERKLSHGITHSCCIYLSKVGSIENAHELAVYLATVWLNYYEHYTVVLLPNIVTHSSYCSIYLDVVA